MLSLTAEQIISQYIKLRDYAKKIKERHKAELAPYDAAMDALAAAAAQMMTELKTTLSSESGSCFWVPQESFKCEDQVTFQSWVRTNNEWRMLTAHVSKEGIRAWREEQKRPLDWPADVEWNPPIPPGIKYDYHMDVQFRKG
jgi:3-methyladenine DNA glycosylase AlkD